ncbi:hypothetical protein [Thermosphaera aggregans]
MKLEWVFMPESRYWVKIDHGDGSIMIELRAEDGVLVEAVLKCRNGEA